MSPLLSLERYDICTIQPLLLMSICFIEERFCILEFESPEAARAAKHDLHSRNSEISVRLRRQENTPNLEAAVKRRERKLKRKLEASKGKDDTATTEESGKKVKTSKSLRY